LAYVTLYITDRDLDAPGALISLRQAEQRVYTIKTTGEVTSLPDVPNNPDGIYLTKDEDHLYVGGSSGLVRYNVYDDGTVAGVDYSYTLYGNKDRPVSLNNVGGMAMDCSGNILISADEELIVLGEDNNKIVAGYLIPGLVNVAFGGKNRNIIVATTKTVMDEYGEKILPQIYYSFVKGQRMPY
jgi:sugar lactone lactonase YvrE